MPVKHYLLTVMTKDNTMQQMHISTDTADEKFVGPLACCTRASSTNFWRDYLADYDVSRVTNVKEIAGSMPYRDINHAN